MLARTRAFTWAELLIVLVAVSIAVLVALPNLLERQTRAKVARTQSDLRTVAVGLECYYIDSCSYPPAVDRDGAYQCMISSPTPHRLYHSVGFVTRALTSPVAHLAAIPIDPFGPRKWSANFGQSYQYAAQFYSYWILTGHGPDMDTNDIKPEAYVTQPVSGDIRLLVTQFSGPYVEYDPTNGTISNGDIFRTGP